ncbi:hypothetical protein NGRA_1805 [Nosema granulosis]|uniref:Uncharacterized protein n=1 Tax=Nosema granulosis TaxID=83296 RepID=A0A9P6H137_9MICR|nr:hypothetical protein NGRA_1805 [Nosema granulosis]
MSFRNINKSKIQANKEDTCTPKTKRREYTYKDIQEIEDNYQKSLFISSTFQTLRQWKLEDFFSSEQKCYKQQNKQTKTPSTYKKIGSKVGTSDYSKKDASELYRINKENDYKSTNISVDDTLEIDKNDLNDEQSISDVEADLSDDTFQFRRLYNDFSFFSHLHEYIR